MLERFMVKVAVGDSGCWEWQAVKTQNGYGKFAKGRVMFLAHRVAYEMFIGPIPDGLVLDHLCRNRSCVNPAHLEAVTFAENMRRSAPAQKTHCANGHTFTPENTYRRPTGQRQCRKCNADAARRYNERRLAV